ncbi:alkene reductase [Brachybacterium sp. GCM10030252]|uniref:alkene reductase n=1 Tax=Brachybacterium sp. GCM10030252 TaxID=3273380 RepID=UPI0036135D3B
MSIAFEPLTLGSIELHSRIAMSPMTRSRAYGPGATVTSLNAEYYRQRASAGMIVTEGIQPSEVGQGYPDTPGLHTAEQVEAWKSVTSAVHAEGGRIVAQLMHTGRIGHPLLTPGRLQPVAPSAVRAEGYVHTSEGKKNLAAPRELSEEEIEQTIGDFVRAARHAVDAGFDGVELHGANGYLIHQFLAPNTNRRQDRWGDSLEGRTRFGLLVAREVAGEIGADRVGFRISPGNPLNGIEETDVEDVRRVYEHLVRGLADLDLAYLHLLEDRQRAFTHQVRSLWPSTLVLNPFTGAEPTGPKQLALLEDGTADVLTFGRMFLANPDLPARLAVGGPFNEPHPTRFYSGDERGYTDYPALAGSAAAVG